MRSRMKEADITVGFRKATDVCDSQGEVVCRDHACNVCFASASA